MRAIARAVKSVVSYLLKKIVHFGYVLTAFMDPHSPLFAVSRCIDEKFALWAFGDVWNKYVVYEKDSTDLMDSWNARHGYLLKLTQDMGVVESMDKMKKLWEKHDKST